MQHLCALQALPSVQHRYTREDSLQVAEAKKLLWLDVKSQDRSCCQGKDTQRGWKRRSVLPTFTTSKQAEMRLWKKQISCWSRSSLKIVLKQGLAFFIFTALLAFKCTTMILWTFYHYRNAPDSFTKLTGGTWQYWSAFSISFFISILFWPVKLSRSEEKIHGNTELWILQRKRRILLTTLFNLACKHHRKEHRKNTALSWEA